MTTPNSPILKILEPGLRDPSGVALLRLGFRPFYLCAAAFAALSIPVWVLVFLGLWPWTFSTPPLLWHAHEMLYGFATAVIIGFLLTASKAWTGLATPRGPQLGALVLLWFLARVGAWTAPYPVYALLDTLLLPTIAAILFRLLRRAGNTRNLPLVGMLALLALTNGVFHLSMMGVLHWPAATALHGALALIVMIEVVMAGRVIPSFTMSANPGLQVMPIPWLEQATLGFTAVGLALWVFAPTGWVDAAALFAAMGLHLFRLGRWRPLLTRPRPMLWILHAAYAWIPVGLGLMAAAQLGLIPISAGVHALAVGATGGLIIGMMTRTARGHTGRSLQASKAEVGAYSLVLSAAALRVLLPLLSADFLRVALISAAVAWSAAFLIYLVLYTPWLMRTRIDGRDG